MPLLAKQKPIKKLFVAKNGDMDAIRIKVRQILLDALFDNSDADLFTVALSGGSMIDVVCDVLSKLDMKPDQWRRWVFYFADERVVGFDDPESTYGQYKSRLVKAIPELGLNQFVIINPESRDAKECAFDYFSKMKRSFSLPIAANGFPSFDVVFLGMGPDGHTASLFPDSQVLQDMESWVVGIENSPKPPSRRITLTIPVLRAARHVVFVVTGESKKEAVKKIFIDKVALPAGLVQPDSRNLNWILDEAAAQLLDPEEVYYENIPKNE